MDLQEMILAKAGAAKEAGQSMNKIGRASCRERV